MKWWKKMTNNILRPERSKKLMTWQERYETAKTEFEDELAMMKTRTEYYEGDRRVKRNPNKGDGYAEKKSINVRNIAFELTESQVDSAIPSPKVTAVHEEDRQLAENIERFLMSEAKNLHLLVMNDEQERTTPIQGSCFTLVEWDNSKGYHCNIGDLAVSNVSPDCVIPQPGITEIDDMDYVFIRTPQTKAYVKRRFGKDVEGESETDLSIREGTANDDIVTVVTAYYRNNDGGIGLYRWCGDTELEAYDDYQARHIEVCAKCGKPKEGDTCECGSKKFVVDNDEMDIVTLFNEVEEGIDEFGMPITTMTQMDVELPYYKPDTFPLIMRRNITRSKHFLGFSDIDIIMDQQDTIKKLGSQINEKLLMAGSYLTLPEGIGVETTDEQYKVIRIQNPAQVSSINVVTAQADTGQDSNALEMNYQWAKSALGITDSFQGKYDSSAKSGTAKQFAINQAAGRLQSKRTLKNEAYAKLYELMFKFALAYADQPIPIQGDGIDGSQEFSHFDKSMFVKQDSDGEWYWNDEFIFDIDPTSTLMTNREAMWQQADMKLQSGAYGPIGDLETNYLYWLEQERNGFPHAGEVKNEIVRRLEEQKAMQQQMAMQQPMPPM